MEKVHIISQTTAGRTVTLTGLTYAAVTQDNILGIINETQSEPLYTPMDLENITSVTYSSGTLTIQLTSTVPSIASDDKLLIKLYFEDDYAKQSNVGTSSDQASESGSSLFAVLKAVWNKVVNIYNALTDGTNGLSAIKSAIPSVSGLALQGSGNATQTDIANAIGTPALGQQSTLFAAIGNISVDTSGLAKQGANEDATNSAVYAILKKIDEQNLIKYSYDGMVFTNGHEPRSAFDVLNAGADYKQYLLEVHNEDDSTIPSMTATDYPALEVFEMKNANAGSTDSWMRYSSTMKEIIIPYYSGGASYFINGMSNLRLLNLLRGELGTHSFSGMLDSCPKLIDIITGKDKSVNSWTLRNWSPTEALFDNSNSLLTQEDISAGFTSNREKLLYNIREHIAANLPTRTASTSLSIKVSSNIKAAIDADSETLTAFTSKYWNITT